MAKFLCATGREDALWVLDGNRRAIGFYEANGCHWDGAVKRDHSLPGLELRERRYRKAL
jgi:hypothetical protein